MSGWRWAREHEHALYLAAIALLLLMDAFFLLTIVFRIGIASGVETGPSAAGGAPSSAT